MFSHLFSFLHFSFRSHPTPHTPLSLRLMFISLFRCCFDSCEFVSPLSLHTRTPTPQHPTPHHTPSNKKEIPNTYVRVTLSAHHLTCPILSPRSFHTASASRSKQAFKPTCQHQSVTLSSPRFHPFRSTCLSLSHSVSLCLLSLSHCYIPLAPLLPL